MAESEHQDTLSSNRESLGEINSEICLDDSNPLEIAVMLGDLDSVRSTLSSQPLPEQWNDGYDYLMLALTCNRHEVAEFLLNLVTRVNSNYSNSTSPLHLAVAHFNLDFVEALLSKGASIDAVDDTFRTPLHHAVIFENYPVVELLLSRGAEPQFTSKDKYFDLTPFEQACRGRNPELLELFLDKGRDKGCDPSSRFLCRSKISSPLRIAVTQGNPSTVRFLLERGAREVAEDEDEGLLHFACKAEEALEMVRILQESDSKYVEEINRKDKMGCTPLSIAVKEAQLELVELLLERGADIGIKDGNGKVPLQLAVEDRLWTIVDRLLSCQSSDQRASVEQEFKMAVLEHGARSQAYETFVKHGYSLEPQLVAEITFAAIERGYFQTVESMLRFDRSCKKEVHQQQSKRLTEARNSEEMSLEHYAAKFEMLDILRLLMREDEGRSAFTLDKKGNSALSYAIKNRDKAIIKTLMADKSRRYSVPLLDVLEYPTLLKLLLQLGVDVDHRLPPSNATTLHSACQLYSYDQTLIELLILHGADVNAVTSDGSTPLHLAIAFSKNSKTSLQTLLSNKAKVNVRDRLGRTPLYLAATSCNSAAIEVLLQYSADLNIQAADGSTALSKAVESWRADLEFKRNLRSLGLEEELNEGLEMLLKHAVKLKVAKLDVSAENWSLVREVDWDMKAFWMKCVEELERMRKARVDALKKQGGKVTLFKVMRMKSKWLVNYLGKPKNRELRKRLENPEIGKEFPLYRDILRDAARTILKELKVSEARKALTKLMRCELPDLCFERIFRCLSDADLKNLHCASLLY